MPASPPATPGYNVVPDKQAARRQPSFSSAHSYSHAPPLSPPPTPVRSQSAQRAPPAPPAYSDDFSLPVHNGKSKRPSLHRRISTATVIRALAAQGRLPAQAGGIVVTPSKVASWLVILVCTAYLGSMLHLPGPIDLLRGSSAASRAMRASTSSRPLADSAARQAWSQEMGRVPANQIGVPVNKPVQHLGPEGYDANVMLEHPELFAATAEQPVRRVRGKKMRQADKGRDAKVHAVVAALAAESAAANVAEPVAAAARESFAIHPDLVPESAAKQAAQRAGRGRGGPVNRLHKIKKPPAAPEYAGVPDSSVVIEAEVAAVAADGATTDEQPRKKKSTRQSRKDEKELAKHARHALARAAERRLAKSEAAKRAAAGAPLVDWSLEGDADEGDE